MIMKQTEKFRQALRDFAHKTTLHGFVNIFNENHRFAQRLLWLMFLLIMITVYLYLVVCSTIKFFKYESSTNIKKNRSDSLTFPAVSICDQNIYPKSVIGSDSHLEQIILKIETGQLKNFTSTEIQEVRSLLANISLSDVILAPVKEFDQKFFNCRFNNQNVKCRDIAEPVMSQTNLCYTFQSDYIAMTKGVLNATRPGYMNGLEIMMDINREDYSITSAGGIGIRMMVHEPYVFPRINERAISIPPGVEAYIEIDKSIEINLNKPYSTVECRENVSSQFEHINISRYSFEGCMLDCMYRYTFISCQCSFRKSDMNKYHNKVCTLEDYYFCLKEKFMQLYTHDCGCIHPCEETWYDYRVSTLEIPSPLLVEIAKVENWKRKTPQDIKDNVIKLYIYFKALESTLIEQVPAYTYDTLIADFGGLLGLFLGASLLTLLEIIEFLCLLLLRKCMPHKVG